MQLVFAMFVLLALLTLATVIHPSTGAPIVTTTAATRSTTTSTTMTTTNITAVKTATFSTNLTTNSTTTTTSTTKTTTTTNKKPVPQTRILSNARAQRLARRLAAVNGCNANVCFSIDGSGSIPPAEFEKEKDFVVDMSSIISVDSAVELAAVEYATATWPINKLTFDTEQFNFNVNKTEQAGGHSFVTGCLNYCISQLWRRAYEANMIILFGDGIETFGSRAAHRADLFHGMRGDISVVAVGNANSTALKEIVGGKEKRIFDIGHFLDAKQLETIIEELVEDVCGIAPL